MKLKIPAQEIDIPDAKAAACPVYLELDQPCPTCNGGFKSGPCSSCKGRKILPTAMGMHIMRFVADNWKPFRDGVFDDFRRSTVAEIEAEQKKRKADAKKQIDAWAKGKPVKREDVPKWLTGVYDLAYGRK